VRTPRRAAVVLSAMALTTALAACGDDNGAATDTGTTGDAPMTEPEDGGIGGDIEDE
jgi:hypothetical protein